MKTREEKEQRKADKVADWLTTFTRAYEMSRAYGTGISTSVWSATNAVNAEIRADVRKTPQDKMFFFDCKIILQGKIKDVVVQHERPVAHV